MIAKLLGAVFGVASLVSIMTAATCLGQIFAERPAYRPRTYVASTVTRAMWAVISMLVGVTLFAELGWDAVLLVVIALCVAALSVSEVIVMLELFRKRRDLPPARKSIMDRVEDDRRAAS